MQRPVQTFTKVEPSEELPDIIVLLILLVCQILARSKALLYAYNVPINILSHQKVKNYQTMHFVMSKLITYITTRLNWLSWLGYKVVQSKIELAT